MEELKGQMKFVYTLDDVCDILKISKPTAREWIKKGSLPMQKVNKKFYISHDNLLKIIEGD